MASETTPANNCSTASELTLQGQGATGPECKVKIYTYGAYRGMHTGPIAPAFLTMASETTSARNCDIVSDPTFAIPTPPVMARTVGPAPERKAPCAPASRASLMMGSKGNL